MGSSKSKSKSTMTGPSWSEANHKTAASDALKSYNEGYGSQVYQGQRVANLDPITTQGVNATGSNLSNYQNYEKSALQNYGSTPSYAEQNLSGLATQNPSQLNGLQEQGLTNALQYAKAQANQSLNAEGMQGGSEAATTLARSLGQVAGDAYSHAYQDNVGNKITATEAMDNGAQNRQSLIGNILGQGNSLAEQAIAGGKVNQQYAQDNLNANIDKFDETQEAPYKAISLLNSATEGADHGYSNQTQTQKNSSGLLGTIGGVGSIASSLAGVAEDFGIL